MKTIVFAVNGKQSYFKCLGFPAVKPNVKLPLIVPLDPGGMITLTIDENKGTGSGSGSDILFTSDQFENNPQESITGNLQSFRVYMSEFNVNFDPKTGQILDGSGGTYVTPADVGGAGNLFYSILGSSALFDGNSPGFDLKNGLGCRGGLLLELSLVDPNGSQPMFDMHIEAAVSMEDVDGDGKFEVMCPFATGVPVVIGDFKETVSILFGVTNDLGGIGILPNGRIIRIPPWGPPERLLEPIAEGLAEVVRGLGLRDLVRDSSNVGTREAIEQFSLEVVEKGLEGALQAVRKEFADRRKDEQMSLKETTAREGGREPAQRRKATGKVEPSP